MNTLLSKLAAVSKVQGDSELSGVYASGNEPSSTESTQQSVSAVEFRKNPNKLFIFGLGYTANILAQELLKQNYEIIGTSRRLNSNSTKSIKIIKFDYDTIKKNLQNSTHLLISIPPNNEGNDIVISEYKDLIINQAQHLKWIGYLSSTSVYGDHQGLLVDEQSKCKPHTTTGISRLKAEKTWLAFAKENNLPLHIFRLSGIYGPARNALDRILNGKKQSIYKKDQVFCRIHVADIVLTIISSISSPNPLSIYNVADDEPAPAYQVDIFAANLLKLEPPALIPIEEALLSKMEAEFYANNRRVSNSKIKQELKIVLHYPSYKEGLTQLWRDYYAHK